MGLSRLVFRSGLGPWGVWTCACGCDDSCVIWEQMEADCPGPPRYYVRHHSPLGCSPDRIGDVWEQEYDPHKNFEAPVSVTSFEEEETPVTFAHESDNDGLENGDSWDMFDVPAYDTYST
jgi:hypothetical protein